MSPNPYFSWSITLGIVFVTVTPVFSVNLAYFKMYDMENNNGEAAVMEFDHSEPHLSSDFKRIMANTHKICTNGLWRLFPGSLYSLIGTAALVGAYYPTGFGFGSSTSYETCTTLTQDEALALALMGSLRRVGPKNLEEISLRTYTGPYYSGIESVIDGENMEDRNLHGYMDSYIITGPRYQHPDNQSAFIPAFQFFEFDRYFGETTCVVMRNDKHGNVIPRKGSAFTSSLYEESVVDSDMAERLGSVRLIPYSNLLTLDICPPNSTYYVPESETNSEYPVQDYSGYGYPSTSTSYKGGYGGNYGESYASRHAPPSYSSSYYQNPSSYGHSSGYSSEHGYDAKSSGHDDYNSAGYGSSYSYQPSYSPPAYQPSYSPPGYEAPSYQPSYEPSYEPPAYQPSYDPPAYQPSYYPSYQPSYSPPNYQPSYEPSYQPSYSPPSYQPSYQPPSYQPSSSATY